LSGEILVVCSDTLARVRATRLFMKRYAEILRAAEGLDGPRRSMCMHLASAWLADVLNARDDPYLWTVMRAAGCPDPGAVWRRVVDEMSRLPDGCVEHIAENRLNMYTQLLPEPA